MAKLMQLELETLHSIPTSGDLKPYAYAVWTDREGNVQMGPIRLRCERLDGTTEYQCSPFPGAWDRHVPESSILRVRSLGALSLHTMTCVCQGTPWDVHCPAPDCTTGREVCSR